jgi:RND family efflux transporter MFP subunit
MKKWLGIGLTFALLAGLTLLIMQRADEVKKARAEQSKPVVLPPASVKVVPVAPHDFVDGVEVTGEILARRVVMVFPKVGGRVEELSTGLGEAVSKGQVLVRIEENDLGWRERQGEAGERAATAAVKQASVSLELAKSEFERARRLHAEGVLPEADLTRAQGQFNAATAAFGAAQANVELARAGAGLAKAARGWTAVESPIDGVVTKRMIDLGVTAGPQQPLFEIQDQSALEILVDVPSMGVDAVKKGAEVTFTVAERPGKVFPAKVKAVGRSLDPATRRLRVELEAPGEVVAEGVWPAMIATVSFKLSERAGVLAAPREAVVTLSDGPAVFVVREGKAVRVAPDLLAGDRTHVPVKAEAGDLVIVQGQDGLVAGAAVKVVAEAAEPKQNQGDAKPDGATPEAQKP